ncbi:protein MpCache1 [Marchantia polymorpha subsp. ruderalis]|uniref:histidine kinase n=2 Tax=Marchantia polymorpha TaxID=3197 RepID=A0AAF6ASI8_MARPO|nr:hypothetical protein MARPO_0001s0444 [Marchantia polymorpha]BBM99408.1 hypothetical protein Mp_1g21090 [Marchantia polymorpha subsp. ruderalis]|eukprot:PTQ50489.1 hypothetical protein MARPO_0001s0444 [Marchantia polymorpha]
MGSSSRCGRWSCYFRCSCRRELRQYLKSRSRACGETDSLGHRLDGRSSGCGRWWSCGDVKQCVGRGTRVWAPTGDAESHRDEDFSDLDRSFEAPKKRASYSVFGARLAIMVMLTILIGLLTILTWHFTTVYTTRSIKSLAFSLRTELLQRPIARMWNLLNATLDTTVTHVNLSKYVVGQYKLPISPGDQDQQLYNVMRNVTWAIFTSRNAVNALTIVYSNGLTQGFERDAATKEEFYSYSVFRNDTESAESPIAAFFPSPSPSPSGAEDFLPKSTADTFTWFREPVNKRTGHKMGPAVEIKPYNLTQDFGGVALLKEGDTSWHITVHRSDDTPFLASGSPVRHPETGEVLAVAGVTQALRGVSQLMQELVTLHSGTIYLTNADGWLLASSTSTPLLKNSSNGPSLIRAHESTDSIISAGSMWLRREYGTDLENLQNVHAEDVVLLGKKYYVDTFVLNLSKLPLVGVIVTPRSFVMGAVDRRGHATLAILISISVCILVVGCLFTLIFTTGVSNEMKLRSELIDHLDARRRAEASSNYKSQFLANMSHELRTPMAAVIGLLDILLCDEYMTSEQVAMVSQIRDCSTALLRLLNNILDLSKVESGKLVLEEADFDLRRELEGLVDMFSVQCDDHSVEIVLELADDIPRLLRGDSARTVQIFANLIANSIKFTSSGHVLVRGWVDPAFRGKSGALSVGKDINSPWFTKVGSGRFEEDIQPSDKICLWFEVDDTGCGIDPSKWETVFDSFVQADPSTTRTYGGTGLGLCIVKSLVNKMGGDIKVMKKESRGTLLKLSLFFKDSPESTIPKTFRDYCASTFFSETLQHSKLVFSVEGRTGGTLMSKWMRDKGLHVVEASSWEETVAELEDMVQENRSSPKFQPLAILDISLVTQDRDLDVLERYTKKGVLIAWLLNHDTSSVTKGDLRKRGFSIMANKPVYKSKLVHLLKMLVGCSTSGEVLAQPKAQGVTPSVNEANFNNGGKPGSWRVALNISQVLTETQNEVTRARSLPLRANSTGRLEQILEHSSHDEELLLIDGHRRRHSEDFPIYKPSNYIRAAPRGLDRFKASGTETAGSGPNPPTVPGTNHVSAPSSSLTEEAIAGSFCRQSSTKLAETATLLSSAKSHPLESLATEVSPKDENHRPNGEADPKRLTESLDVADKVQLSSTPIPGRHPENCAQNGKHSVSEQLTSSLLTVDAEQNIPNGVVHKDGSSRLEQPSGEALDVPVDKPVRLTRVRRKDENSPSTRIGPQDALKGIRILLAEDTPVLQRVATMMLEKLGATVSAVGDGLQAVNALTQCPESNVRLERDKIRKLKYLEESSVPYDLVLMDCQMPKLDGYDATRAIRQAEKGTSFHIPIVALTAHAMSSDEAKCLEVGMDAYLTKPIDPKLMMSTITNLTRRQKPSQQGANDGL